MTGSDSERSFFERSASTIVTGILVGALAWVGNAALSVRDHAAALGTIERQIEDLRRQDRDVEADIKALEAGMIRNSERLDHIERVETGEHRNGPAPR